MTRRPRGEGGVAGRERRSRVACLHDIMAYEDIWEKNDWQGLHFGKVLRQLEGEFIGGRTLEGKERLGEGQVVGMRPHEGLDHVGSWKAQCWFRGVLLLDSLSAGSVSAA